MILNKIGLLGKGHDHAGIVAPMLWFILNGHGIDAYAQPFHGIYVLNKIIGIHTLVFCLQVATHTLSVGFHPQGRCPG